MAKGATARATVEVSTGNSRQQLEELRGAVERAAEALTKAQKSNDHAAIQKARRELKGAKGDLEQVERSIAATNAAGKKLSVMPYNQLKQAQRQLSKELRGMTRGTQEYIDKSKKLSNVTQELRKVEEEMGRVKKAQGGLSAQLAGTFKGANNLSDAFGKMGGVVKGALGGLGVAVSAAAAAIGSAVAFLSGAFKSFNEFEEKMADLQAITNKGGEDLDYLKEKARELSGSVTEDGVRIRASAGEVVQAFTAMFGAKPELGASKEALAEATEAALTLGTAARMEATEAVEAMATTMNQFNAGADQAKRYMNVLAAGSAAGAAMVTDVAASIKNFGASAAGANISVEESVGLIETLAGKGIKGEVAGTKLNAVLVKLQTGADEFNPKIVGMAKALENLEKANLSTAEKVKIFGEGNIGVGQILIKERKTYEDLTKAVTGTNVALQQAAAQSNTNEAKLAQLNNRWDNFKVEIAEKLQPFVGWFLDALSWLWDGLATLGEVLKPIGTALVNGIKILYSLADPIGAVTKLVKGAAYEFEGLTMKVEDANEAIAEQVDKANTLFEVTKRTEQGTEARRKAIEKINAEYGPYLENLLTEESSLADIEAAQRAATAAVRENTIAKLKAQETQKIIEKEVKESAGLQKKLADNLKKEFGDAATIVEGEVQRLLKLDEKAFKEGYDQLLKQYNIRKTGAIENAGRALTGLQSTSKLIEELRDVRIASQKATEEVNTMFESLSDGPVKTYNHSTNNEQPEAATTPAAAPTNSTDTTKAASGKAKYQQELENLKQYIAEKQLIIEQDTNNGILAEEERNQRLLALRYEHLERQKEILEQNGQSTTEIELQIEALRRQQMLQAQEEVLQKEKEINDQILADKKRVQEAEKAALKEQTRIAAEEAAKQAKIAKQQADERRKTAEAIGSHLQGMAENMGKLIGDFAMDAEDAQKNFGKAMAKMALDTLHKVIQGAIAKIWAEALAGPDSIATFGAAGFAKATALTVAVEAAFAVAKRVMTAQNYEGRITTIGAQDGRTYNVPYIGWQNDITYIPNPSLISERGGEIIIDHARSRNMAMNYPWLIDAIRRVPQHAEGRLPTDKETIIPIDPPETPQQAPIATETMLDIKNTLQALNDTLNRGIYANISYKEMQEQRAAAKRAEQSAFL